MAMIAAVGVQDCQHSVIPAQAGIQTKDFSPVSLAPRLRGGDGKNKLANGLPKPVGLRPPLVRFLLVCFLCVFASH